MENNIDNKMIIPAAFDFMCCDKKKKCCKKYKTKGRHCGGCPKK